MQKLEYIVLFVLGPARPGGVEGVDGGEHAAGAGEAARPPHRQERGRRHRQQAVRLRGRQARGKGTS